MVPKDLEDYLMACLGEESGEVNQALGKITRFGWDDKWGAKALSNREKLVGEINDLVAVAQLMREQGIELPGLFDPHALQAKKDKIFKYMPLSVKNGCLIPMEGEDASSA